MKLPNFEHAYVPPEKLTGYLLNLSHEEGHGKAQFFIYFGFSMAQWRELEHALILHAHTYEVNKQEMTRFGVRYVIEGALETPSGRMPEVRVVWFVPTSEHRPRLVTAYALEE